MMKLARKSLTRKAVLVLALVFVLVFQLVQTNSASAYDEDQANKMTACLDESQYPLDMTGWQRDQQAQAIIDCAKGVGMSLGEIQAFCTQDEYKTGNGLEKCEALQGNRVLTDPDSLGARQPGAATPEDNKCVSNNRFVAWFGCPLIDSTSNTIIRTYSSIVEDWLVFDPEIIRPDLASPKDTATYRVWSAIRVWANIIFFVLLLVMVYGQITGMQAFSLRKLMPKLVLTIILVNLSYYICQIAVDICNILGSGIGKFFIGWSEQIDLSTVGGFGGFNMGATVIVVVILVVVGIIVASLAIGPALFLPVIIAIIGGLLTILFTFAMLIIRQALMILMIVLSPVAIALSVLPNTESVYKKWFNLSRGLLLTYPLASFLLYGGNFAGRLILKVWNDNSFIVATISLVICVYPITMLPKLTRSSIAAIDRMMLKAQNGLKRFGTNRVMDNKYAERAMEIKRGKAERRASLSYLDKKTGELKRIHAPDWMPRNKPTIQIGKHTFGGGKWKVGEAISASADYNLRRAEKSASRERRYQFLQDNPDGFDAMQTSTDIKAAEVQLDAMGNLGVGELSTILDSSYDSAADNGMVYAATRRLFESGQAGRDALREIMKRKDVTGDQEASMRSICSAIASFGDEGKYFDPEMTSFSNDVLNNGVSATGRYADYDVPASAYEGITGEKLAKADTSALLRMHSKLGTLLANPATAAQAKNIISSSQRLLQSTDTRTLSMDKRRIIEQMSRMM